MWVLLLLDLCYFTVVEFCCLFKTIINYEICTSPSLLICSFLSGVYCYLTIWILHSLVLPVTFSKLVPKGQLNPLCIVRLLQFAVLGVLDKSFNVVCVQRSSWSFVHIITLNCQWSLARLNEKSR